MNRNHKKSQAAVVRFHRAVAAERQYIIQHVLRNERVNFPDFYLANFFFYLECEVRSLMSMYRVSRTALHYDGVTDEQRANIQKGSAAVLAKAGDLAAWITASQNQEVVSSVVRELADPDAVDSNTYDPGNHPVEFDTPGKLSGKKFLTLLDTIRPEQQQAMGLARAGEQDLLKGFYVVPVPQPYILPETKGSMAVLEDSDRVFPPFGSVASTDRHAGREIPNKGVDEQHAHWRAVESRESLHDIHPMVDTYRASE